MLKVNGEFRDESAELRKCIYTRCSCLLDSRIWPPESKRLMPELCHLLEGEASSGRCYEEAGCW